MTKLKVNFKRRIFCTVFAIMFFCVSFLSENGPFFALAAGEDATIVVSLDRNNFNVGDTFNVKVTYQSNIESGYLTWKLTYDNSLVEREGSSGEIIETEWFDDQAANTKNVTKSYSFRAKAVGKVNFSVSATSYKLQPDANGDSMTVLPVGASANIVDVGSSDATLKALTVDGGTLSPVFSPNTTAYTVTVPYDVTALYLFPVTSDSRATHSIEGDEFLNVGTKTRTIVVTAQDGTVKKYVVTITRLPKATVAPTVPPTTGINPGTATATPVITPTPTITETPHDGTVIINGISYKIGAIDASVVIPEGFERVAVSYKGIEYAGAKGISKNMTIMYLVSDSNKGIFIYDEKNDEFFKYVDISVKSGLYSLMKLYDENQKLNRNITTVTIGDNVVEAYEFSPDNKDFYIVRAMNWNGEVGYYTYDTVENTMQRYVDFKVTENGSELRPAATDSPTGTDAIDDKDDGKMDPETQRVLILFVVTAGAICICVAAFLVYFALKERKTCKIMTSDDESQGE